MKARVIIVLFLFWVAKSGVMSQELEAPSLAQKNMKGEVSMVEAHYHQFVQGKGLILTKKEVETYNKEGYLSELLTEEITKNQRYKTVYTLNKKGLLSETKIINPANNLILRTTSYEYKKGLLIKTVRTRGPDSVTKEYVYNKKNHLTQVTSYQNGELALTEYYEKDEKDRLTKLSHKLADETETKRIYTNTYEEKNGQLIRIQNRPTDAGEYQITKYSDLESGRDVKEHTTIVGTDREGEQHQLFLDDTKGNWTKVEVIDDQFGRSLMVLKKITYRDGLTTGRTEMLSPEDDRGQFIRKNYRYQLAINGRPVTGGIAHNVLGTDNRLAWVAESNTWVLLKDYNTNSNMSKWLEARVLSTAPDQPVYVAKSNGVDVFNKGKKLVKGTTSYSGFSEYRLASSSLVYVKDNLNKTFIASHTDQVAGQVLVPEMTDNNYYWGKVTDSTYVLANRGRSISIQKQVEDKDGNKLTMSKQGNIYYWYFMPDFRSKYDNSSVGDVHLAEQVYDPEKFLAEQKFKADFSGFGYTKLANSRYRLLTRDGQSVTNIASKTFKTPDDKLVTYFPLTEQYLEMENFYQLESGKEWTSQSVNIVTDSTAYAYYLYKNNEKIVFYTPEGRISKRAYANHRLNPEKQAFGAIVYDSTSSVNYGMTYNLKEDSGFGPMRKLPTNSLGAYLLKLEANRWVIFEKGIKVKDYSFSKRSEEGSVIHFFKNKRGENSGMLFSGFDEAKPGHFIHAKLLTSSEVDKYMKELEMDSGLEKKEAKSGLPGKPLSFDKIEERFYARDVTGKFIDSSLKWFIDDGARQDLLTYDSASGITYRAKGYYENKRIVEGTLEELITPDDIKALKRYQNEIYLSIDGIYQSDVVRSYITQNANDEIWNELFFDISEEKSYLLSYPSDSSFHLIEPQLLPGSYNHSYLFRVNEKSFVTIERGQLVGNKEIKSRVLGQNLIQKIPTESGEQGYLFRDYKSTDLLTLIPAEEIPADELDVLWTKAGEELKKGQPSGSSTLEIPNDKWMAAINKCGSNNHCVANIIDQMGQTLKQEGYDQERIERTIMPYLVGIGKQNKDRLFETFMVLKSDYVGVISNPQFPKELSKYIKDRSKAIVNDYTNKNGKPKIKTVEYKGKGGGN